jgi:D-arabinose 1-dehydrogenase-like Zn-dependent alcohol dehydrogenase
MASIPETMRSLVAPKYCDPAGYEIVELPVPSIQQPDEVLVKMQAAAIVSGDTHFANGSFRMLVALKYVAAARNSRPTVCNTSR